MLKSRSGRQIHFEADQEKISKLVHYRNTLGDKFPKIGILVLTYNASKLIEKTLSRIPKELHNIIQEIFIFDDNSPDNTYEVAKGLSEGSFWKSKLSIFKNPSNLRYGGNQKTGYHYAIDKGMDLVIMLHGDGQYAPEYIPDLILPCLEEGKKIVFASRMMLKKEALKGGMPFYKFIGNQILTKFENMILGTKLYEFHSGYRLYSTDFLKKIPFEENTDDFHFDTQIIIQSRALGEMIHEVPIKTFYGDEECNVDGFQYAWDVVKSVISYRLHQLHIIREPRFFLKRSHVTFLKRSPFSSHQKIIKHIKSRSKVLDVGGGEGLLYQALRKSPDVSITVYDEIPVSQSGIAPEHYRQIDFQDIQGLPINRDFDYVILSDSFQKVLNPEILLKQIKKMMKIDGEIIICVSNIAHWYTRFGLIFGRFQYTESGILDKRHLKLYTRESFKYYVKECGIKINRMDYTGIPFEVILESIGQSSIVKILDSLYYFFVLFWNKLFAYQFIIFGNINSLAFEEGEGKIN